MKYQIRKKKDIYGHSVFTSGALHCDDQQYKHPKRFHGNQQQCKIWRVKCYALLSNANKMIDISVGYEVIWRELS
jgi:hypothetical protein